MYTIYIVTLPDYVHTQGFREVAMGLQEGFAELGYVVPIVTDVSLIRGRAVVLGANLLPTNLPPNSIILNLEQGKSGWLNESYLNLLRQHEVWDYNYNNIELLKTKGIEAKYCGIGYEPCLTCVPQINEDIDVLFSGAVFGRRIPILQAIEATGLTTKWISTEYGEQRNAWIARSKIVINIHAYEPDGPFEIVRVSQLLANSKFVISEGPVSEPLADALIWAPAEDIPWLCEKWVTLPNARRTIARRGFEIFSSTRQSAYIKPLLTP